MSSPASEARDTIQQQSLPPAESSVERRDKHREKKPRSGGIRYKEKRRSRSRSTSPRRERNRYRERDDDRKRHDHYNRHKSRSRERHKDEDRRRDRDWSSERRKSRDSKDERSKRFDDKEDLRPARRPSPARVSLPQQEMILVTVNDRLGTKKQIPCLPTDTIKDFKSVVAMMIGRRPHEILLKRQSERPFKDILTLQDYSISHGAQLDLEVDTGD